MVIGESMSGGSYDYFYGRMQDCVEEIKHKHPHSRPHLQFYKLMKAAAQVFYEIEWADSGDTGPEDAKKAINDYLTFLKQPNCTDCEILKAIRELVK